MSHIPYTRPPSEGLVYDVPLKIQQKNRGKIEGQLHNNLFSVFRNGVLVFIRHVLHLRNPERQPAIVIFFAAFLIPEREQMPVFPKKKTRRFYLTGHPLSQRIQMSLFKKLV